MSSRVGHNSGIVHGHAQITTKMQKNYSIYSHIIGLQSTDHSQKKQGVVNWLQTTLQHKKHPGNKENKAAEGAGYIMENTVAITEPGGVLQYFA